MYKVKRNTFGQEINTHGNIFQASDGVNHTSASRIACIVSWETNKLNKIELGKNHGENRIR